MIPPRITIDASHTAGSGKNTGIERVVRNLHREIPEIARERGWPAPELATYIHGEFFGIDSKQSRSLDRLSRWEANAQEFVPDWLQAVPLALGGFVGQEKIKKWMKPAPSHLGAYKLPHHAYRTAIQTARRWRGKPVAASSNHWLVLPDAYWTVPEVWETVAKHRRAGGFVVTVVYDLIPLTHPQFVGERRSRKFRRYLDDVLIHSDLIASISRTVRDDVLNYIECQRPRDAAGICREVHAFTLGAEIRQSRGIVRPPIQQLFGPGEPHPPYLMVASFDPRKNHAQALDAFDRLWEVHPDLKLCFAGRAGAMCEELMERIAAHPRLNRGLHVIHDLSDAELQHAYHHCSGVLLPSMVEGFGLPIVESLWYGKKTFASDTPIHREVGGPHCEYFPLNCPEALADAIARWESERRAFPATDGATVPRFTPPTWRDSARELLALCERFAPQRLDRAQVQAA